MTVKEFSSSQHIRFKGVFDFQEVYGAIYQWLETRGFEVHESKHKNVEKQTGFERDIAWVAWRRVTEYYSWWVQIDLHTWDTSEVDVIKEGVKKRMWKGRFYFLLRSHFEMDYSDRFADTAIKKGIVQFFTTHIFQRKISSLWEDKLRFKLYELANVVKECLDMQIKGNEAADMYVKYRESPIGFKPEIE